ncbi:MAG: nickel-dependent lactate racemase [Synergistaceae bacterium]|jgi:hypothetical protein|nr:nickel-dependent lactate racemase [Synergistaceae bacterium]
MTFQDVIPYRLAKPDFAGFPKMTRVRQNFTDVFIDDIEERVHEEITRLALPELTGKKIAITAGSRGIPNITRILKAVGGELKALGAAPFVVPAMGGHGNATAQGQLSLLREYGITEETVDMPLRSSMDTVLLGNSENGAAVYCDRNAYEADWIVVCGRVKPHTDFRWEIESGMCKMMVVGLGKYDGATAFHKTGTGEMGERLVNAARVFITKAKVLCGMAVIDNPYHKTHSIEAVKPENIIAREPELLREATKAMSKILLEEADVLVVDYFGKEISGSGMDPNVTGRFFHSPDVFYPNYPRIKKISVLRITRASHGNAAGIGVADFISRKAAQSIDLASVYTNCLTSRYSIGGKLPMVMNNDFDAIYAAASSSGAHSVKDARIIRIKNTLALDNIWVSENMSSEVKGNGALEIEGEPSEILFDSGNDISGLE